MIVPAMTGKPLTTATTTDVNDRCQSKH